MMVRSIWWDLHVVMVGPTCSDGTYVVMVGPICTTCSDGGTYMYYM